MMEQVEFVADTTVSLFLCLGLLDPPPLGSQRPRSPARVEEIKSQSWKRQHTFSISGLHI